jgi:hypothetical protein
MAFANSGVVGVNLNATYISVGEAPFSVGTVVQLNDGGEAMFVEASASALSTYNAVVINDRFRAANLTTTNAVTAGKQVGFAQVSIATGYCGWVQLSGRPKVNLAASCDDFVPLYTTATIGVLDDATVSGTGGAVMGVFSTVTISNATAVTCIVPTRAFVATGVQGT